MTMTLEETIIPCRLSAYSENGSAFRLEEFFCSTIITVHQFLSLRNHFTEVMAGHIRDLGSRHGCQHHINLCPNLPVRIDRTLPKHYETLHEAHSNTDGYLTIKSLSDIVYENLAINIDKSLSLKGGYDCDYSISTGATIINAMTRG